MSALDGVSTPRACARRPSGWSGPRGAWVNRDSGRCSIHCIRRKCNRDQLDCGYVRKGGGSAARDRLAADVIRPRSLGGTPILRAFLDFEASSLGRHGFPIEVAWVFENGAEETYLIRPAADWTDWDPAAQALHTISRDRLDTEGVPVETVARRLIDTIGDHEVFASAPSWDGKWLSLLLRTAGLPRRGLRLVDTDIGLLELASAILAPSLPSPDIPRATRRILADVEARFAGRQPVHRALPDARAERERWLAVSELAHAFCAEAELR